MKIGQKMGLGFAAITGVTAILGITAFVLVARPLAVMTGMIVIGGSTRESLRVGQSVTPLGEWRAPR